MGLAPGLQRWRARAFSSVRGRATLIATATTAVVLTLCLVLYWTLLIERESDAATKRAGLAGRQLGAEISLERVPELLPAGDTDLLQIVTADGQVLAATAPLQGRPPMTDKPPAPGELRVEDTRCPAELDHCLRIVGVRFINTAYGQPLTIYAAVPIGSLADDPVHVFVPIGLLLVFLLLVAVLTWSAIGLAFRPVEAIRREMAEITATGLDHRVPVPQTGGEIQSLAETVNETLERLERATERERRFVSDASHDLRNPIAGLHMGLEVALTDPDDTLLRPALESALRDTERLNDIVDDLLELSRLDAGVPRSNERLDLGELVAAEVARRPDRRTITTDLEPAVLVEANRVRVNRVLVNLLANAERHARNTIHVTVRAESGQAVLTVDDDGAGIPEDSRERVFERFARLPDARRLDSGGTGLGLPIAREIAHTHGGTLTAHPSPTGGARLTLTLPLAPPP